VDLKTYYKEIGRYPLLSPEKERDLAKLSFTGNLEARNCLVNSNLRLVIHIVKEYSTQSEIIADLISAGNLGLIKAAEKYEVKHNCRFSTYAQFWIRQKITDVLWHKRMVRLPSNKLKQLSVIKRMMRHRRVTAGEISTSLGINKRSVEDLLQLMDEHRISIESPSDESRYTLAALSDSGTSDVIDILCIIEMQTAVKIAINSLKDMEKKVVMAYFGIDSESQTLESIGKKIGLSKERIRQIRNNALDKLRKTQGLKDHLSSEKH